MKLFFSDAQLAHKPKQYMVHGRIVDPFESPERATTLLNALEKCGLIPTAFRSDSLAIPLSMLS